MMKWKENLKEGERNMDYDIEKKRLIDEKFHELLEKYLNDINFEGLASRQKSNVYILTNYMSKVSCYVKLLEENEDSVVLFGVFGRKYGEFAVTKKDFIRCFTSLDKVLADSSFIGKELINSDKIHLYSLGFASVMLNKDSMSLSYEWYDSVRTYKDNTRANVDIYKNKNYMLKLIEKFVDDEIASHERLQARRAR